MVDRRSNMKRRKMSRSKSRRDFSRKSGMHPKNAMGSGGGFVMRGGIRL